MLVLSINVLRGSGSEKLVYQTTSFCLVDGSLKIRVTLDPNLSIAFNTREG
jgi:hypothetical protein